MGVAALSEVSSGVAAAGVFLLALVAPFEAARPLVRLPWQSLSNLEGAVLAALVAWGAAMLWTRSWPRVDTPLVAAGLGFLLAMALAAAAAPADRTNAWHMTGRLVAAAAIYTLVVHGITTRRRLRLALALAVGSGVVVALLALLEYFQVGTVLRILRLFRPGVTAVGAQVRAGGPLQYPTIASMYLEVVFALGLGLMLTAIDARNRWRALGWFVALAVIGHAIVLTFTRAGLVVMIASGLLVGVTRARGRGVERGSWALGALAVVIAALFLASRSPQSLWLRMTTEGQDAWYRADVQAPKTLTFAVDRAQYVATEVTNTGRVAWDSRDPAPILFSYHWLDAAGARVVAYEGDRTEFAATVNPGDTVRVNALVRAPRQPGDYRLEWDLVQEGRLWFSTEPDAPDSVQTLAQVSGAGIGGPIATSERPRRAVRPGRFVLWRTAVRMVAAHPLLGVGPDNFRLLYGSYAGLPGADPRTHSNNMYLEVLVSGGLVAAAALLWLLRDAFVLFRPAKPRAMGAAVDPTPIALGIAASGLAIALHGLVDSFLSFAPTYILFALTLGFAAAARDGLDTGPDAHRA